LIIRSRTNTEIVLGGFSGKFGVGTWKLTKGDEALIQVWAPQTKLGPATKRFDIVDAPKK
jgi:hypothetical protein